MHGDYVRDNGKLLPDILLVLLTLCYTILLLGNTIKCHEEFFSSQPMVPPKRLDISFPRPDWADAQNQRVKMP